MQTAVPEALDLSSESRSHEAHCTASTARRRREYGTRCLLARRLVERGVRFVQFFLCGSALGHAQQERRDAQGALRPHRSAERGAWCTTSSSAACSIRRSSSGRASSAACRSRRGPTAATTTATPSPSGWPAAASRPATPTARPTSSATSRSRTSSPSTTCTPRSCTPSASITDAHLSPRRPRRQPLGCRRLRCPGHPRAACLTLGATDPSISRTRGTGARGRPGRCGSG